MNIGLTGGIASGKSTVSAMLVDKGARLVDADRIAREIVLPGSPVLAQIAERFGQDMLLQDGALDRKRLGAVVFGDEAERKALEGITHPAIRQRMLEQMRSYEQEQPDKLVVVDVPLIYESRMESLFEAVMVVYVHHQVQLERLMKRDSLTEQQAKLRLAAQMDIEEKRSRADYVIYNDQGIEHTARQVHEFLSQKGLL
ncbi:dephospho-CoA kinase [Paenibacillus sp. UMB4589-SE434]|uniref:dephospho-CoA kinase n=1 Tax=Paenibacillus sp. UMB4589-SE434 TaxID=3046314 RepID=UPI0025511956|nr:dephospho-CoA kinase [Paenibacillus sp. UMB4589-SE434]MDK8182368.1 dephospho-CoA kinase [Paenibacillus sp. UMB4589-SE434]